MAHRAGLAALQDGDGAGRFVEAHHAAAVLGQADVGARVLALAGFATQLQRQFVDHRQAGGAHRVALADQPARQVDRLRAAKAGGAAGSRNGRRLSATA